MKRSNALGLAGIVMGAVALGHAQIDAPKNLAGAEFPCTYTKPASPYTMTAKFLETIDNATFATGFQVQSDNVTIRAENAVCHGNGECELTGTVTVTMTPRKTQGK
jgi:hypothetical protein